MLFIRIFFFFLVLFVGGCINPQALPKDVDSGSVVLGTPQESGSNEPTITPQEFEEQALKLLDETQTGQILETGTNVK